MKTIKIKEREINITGINDNDYISLTDIARIKNQKEPKDVVKNWMRLRSTLEYLELWERLNNPNFNRVEFDPLLSESGKNSFTMSPTRWVREFNAIGIKTKPTKNGGTFAHKDIALEFQNSKLIEQNIPQRERLILLNEEANREKMLFNNNNLKLKKG